MKTLLKTCILQSLFNHRNETISVHRIRSTFLAAIRLYERNANAKHQYAFREGLFEI